MDVDARRALVHTARSIIEPSGQRVSATDRLYLPAWLPTLLVWGERDRMIPVAHARRAAAEMPGSWLEVFEPAGHFPFNDDLQRFVAARHASGDRRDGWDATRLGSSRVVQLPPFIVTAPSAADPLAMAAP